MHFGFEVGSVLFANHLCQVCLASTCWHWSESLGKQSADSDCEKRVVGVDGHCSCPWQPSLVSALHLHCTQHSHYAKACRKQSIGLLRSSVGYSSCCYTLSFWGVTRAISCAGRHYYFGSHLRVRLQQVEDAACFRCLLV